MNRAQLLNWRGLAPGVALAGVLVMAASTMSKIHGGPLPLYALFFGMAFHHLSQEQRTRPGIEFCAREVLRLGVALLGAQITATQIEALGLQAAIWVVLGVTSTMLLALWLGGRLGLGSARATLAGGAVAICGASAALAISAALPAERERDRFTLTVVICITVMSTATMIFYPMLARILQLSPTQAGLFLGGSIHDVAQVVGAGFTLGPETGETATVVKMFRVALLVVVVLVVTLAFKASRERAARTPNRTTRAAQPALMPWFLWTFVALVALNSTGWLSPVIQNPLNDLSRGCLLLAIAALGVKSSFAQVTRAGWKPLFLIAAETLWLGAFMVIGARIVV